MKHLRFPIDIDAPSTDENGNTITDENGNTVYFANDAKRYFKIIVKELPTTLEYVKEKADTVLAQTSSTILNAASDPVGTLKQSAKDAAEKVEEAKTLIAEGGVTAIQEKTSETASKIVEALNPEVKDNAGNTIFGIALPLPNELNESVSHNWEKTTSIQADVAGNFMNKIPFGAKALSQMANNNIRKPTIDPGYFQDYNGTEPRSFSFSWDLIPRNRSEASQIREIIMHLKKFTLPSRAVNGLVMNSPHHFDIEFGNEFFSTLVNMKGLVCTQMDVSYSADGTMQMTEDGMPKYIRLSLNFAERRALYAEDFKYGDVAK